MPAEKATAQTSRSKGSQANSEAQVLANIADMSGSDREIAERLHAIVRDVAPTLTPRLWYGMPAYAKDGKVLCFFQAAAKFDTRYATLGFQDNANLDDGTMWPVAYAVTQMTAAEESIISKLLKAAAD